MNTLLIALSLGLISMIIVFVSGITSGVVRLTTLAGRVIFAFCMTSTASYFFMMLFDLYNELREKKIKKLEEELAEAEITNSENANPEENSTQQPPGFQPINVNDLPNVSK